MISSPPPAAERMARAPDATMAQTRFGLCVRGLSLLIATGQRAEYLSDAPISPIPQVGRRLRGATQVRGQPVLVFNADSIAPNTLPLASRAAIVLVNLAQSAYAIQVVQAPSLLDSLEVCAASPPEVGFAGGLITPYRARIVSLSGSTQQDSRIWWETDFDRLFKALANE